MIGGGGRESFDVVDFLAVLAAAQPAPVAVEGAGRVDAASKSGLGGPDEARRAVL